MTKKRTIIDKYFDRANKVRKKPLVKTIRLLDIITDTPKALKREVRFFLLSSINMFRRSKK